MELQVGSKKLYHGTSYNIILQFVSTFRRRMNLGDGFAFVLGDRLPCQSMSWPCCTHLTSFARLSASALSLIDLSPVDPCRCAVCLTRGAVRSARLQRGLWQLGGRGAPVHRAADLQCPGGE